MFWQSIFVQYLNIFYILNNLNQILYTITLVDIVHILDLQKMSAYSVVELISMHAWLGILFYSHYYYHIGKSDFAKGL